MAKNQFNTTAKTRLANQRKGERQLKLAAELRESLKLHDQVTAGSLKN